MLLVLLVNYLVITFNYKEGTKTITFAEIEEAFGSDLSSLTAPSESFENTAFSRLFSFASLLADAQPPHRFWGIVKVMRLPNFCP